MALRVLACLILLLPVGCGEELPSQDSEVPVRVGMVAVDNSNVPVVILEEEGGERWLPIWIGTAEARSIAAEMEEHDPPRPNTHDLAKSLISGLEGEVERVVVTELRNGTYYALLFLRANGQVVEFDSRPSDAIAIALRTQAPIFVRARVFDAAGEASTPRPEGRRIRWRPPEARQGGRVSAATPRVTL
jgi:bifunctional DNase/RNase